MSLDPTSLLAASTSAAGSAIAIAILTKNPTAAQAAQLTALATALPLIPQGKLSPAQLGAVAGQLTKLQGSVNTTETAVIAQLGSLVAVIEPLITAGGDLDATSSLVFGALQNLANGINTAVAFWQGEQAVLNPPAAS